MPDPIARHLEVLADALATPGEETRRLEAEAEMAAACRWIESGAEPMVAVAAMRRHLRRYRHSEGAV